MLVIASIKEKIMKRFCIILLTLILCLSCARGETIATFTDLSEEEEIFEEIFEELFEDEDIEADIEDLSVTDNRHIELIITKYPTFFSDEAILEATLIDYPPIEIVLIEWQYSEDNLEWNTIEDETELTYKFIYTRENMNYWYRITITYNEI